MFSRWEERNVFLDFRTYFNVKVFPRIYTGTVSNWVLIHFDICQITRVKQVNSSLHFIINIKNHNLKDINV